ncbi:DUF177 domain-containing protein [Albidovulum sp.]
MQADGPALTRRLRVRDLPARRPTRFALHPDAAERAALAGELGLVALPALAFSGEVRPQGGRDWVLEGELVAEVVQSCIVTLAPVTTRITEAVQRRYIHDLPEPEAEEMEMPGDDTLEPLCETIEIGAVLREALALALPAYPRAEGASFGAADFAAPGVKPLTDEAVKPFAGLSDLLRRGKDEA